MTDPQYQSRTDLHPQQTSPAVDTGFVLGYSADVEGKPVPQDNNHDGVSEPNRGAYETTVGSTFPPTVDPDGDGFSNAVEIPAGTDPMLACGINAWPPDFDNDRSVTGADLSVIAASIGQSIPPASPRLDIAPDPSDGFITGSELSVEASLIGRSCAP